MLQLSELSRNLQQSGIRSASIACAKVGGINLGQGVCDIATPTSIRQAAYAAIEAGHNTYTSHLGILELRQAVSHKLKTFNHIEADPEANIMITNGATGAFVAACYTLFNPGDEIILFEPFYGYHKNLLDLCHMSVKTVPINLDDFSIDFAQLRQAISPKTRGIVVCTPSNPCGKVFSQEELSQIGQLATEFDLRIITDEIYEYITYPGFTHVSMASLAEFYDRTITISGFSKTYNMTGWRLGYATGPDYIIEKMALIHDLLYICPATPLQYGVLAAFDLPERYYTDMQAMYLNKRELVVQQLQHAGFKPYCPQGAYYIMVDFSQLGFADDQAMVDALLQQAKVAVVPGRAFYKNPNDGKHLFRLCYSLNEQAVSQALAAIVDARFS